MAQRNISESFKKLNISSDHSSNVIIPVMIEHVLRFGRDLHLRGVYPPFVKFVAILTHNDDEGNYWKVFFKDETGIAIFYDYSIY